MISAPVSPVLIAPIVFEGFIVVSCEKNMPTSAPSPTARLHMLLALQTGLPPEHKLAPFIHKAIQIESRRAAISGSGDGKQAWR
jgi:hypothetical protein